MKKLVGLLLLFLLFFNINTIEAQAKSYIIEEADFDIVILPNGDVEVTETWRVEYFGYYNRFFKSLPPENISKGENYKNVILSTC